MTGQKKLIRKNKHSLSLSPIRNTLAKNKEKYVSCAVTGISKYTDNRYDSTQESLNIDAYMQNNSTLAIEEVDEDDYKEHLPLIQNIQKPKDLPAFSTSPKFKETKRTRQNTRNKRLDKKKLDSWIFIDDQDTFERGKHRY